MDLEIRHSKPFEISEFNNEISSPKILANVNDYISELSTRTLFSEELKIPHFSTSLLISNFHSLKII